MTRVHLPHVPLHRGGGQQQEQQVYRVTDARRPHSDDQHSRVVKYLVSMSVRMVCLGAALFTPAPWLWLFVAGAVVLPYVAVVIANAGVEQRPERFQGYEGDAPREIDGQGRNTLGNGGPTGRP